MEDGRWKMEDGRWKMEDGGMEDGEPGASAPWVGELVNTGEYRAGIAKQLQPPSHACGFAIFTLQQRPAPD